MEQNKENVTEATKPRTDHFAMEYLKHEQEKSKAKDRGIITLGILTGISILGIVGTAMFMSNMNHQNDKEWRELFSLYDYVSQDGNGYNNYNTGSQGDVNNGATSKEKDKQE